jgi:hypothetical protein
MNGTRKWALLWQQRGPNANRHVMWQYGHPLLFATRKEARMYARKQYGYIRTRKDLRAPPHGWRMPKAIRVVVKIELEQP